MLGKVVIVGVGLIGGSFALALKRAGAVRTVVGMGRSPAVLARARELGIIDAACESPQEAMHGADLVLLAEPVAQTGPILARLAPWIEERTVITDAGSTKSDVVAAARAALGARIAQFVPGHPIAGRESNGPDAALPDLYRGKKTVITALPENAPGAIERVAGAWRACGAVIHRLTPQEHDRVFAAVSHLPHLIAFALMNGIAGQAQGKEYLGLAGPGFRDFSRIAASDPKVWRDILLANRQELLAQSQLFQQSLKALEAMIESGNSEALEQAIGQASQARANWRMSHKR